MVPVGGCPHGHRHYRGRLGGRSSAAEDAEPAILILGDASSLDAGLATDTTSSNIIQSLNEPLVNFGPPPQLKAIPAAAQSWTVKGPVVTIKLRNDLSWTTGQQVTAQDYVWSWLRAISPELASEYAYQFMASREPRRTTPARRTARPCARRSGSGSEQDHD